MVRKGDMSLMNRCWNVAHKTSTLWQVCPCLVLTPFVCPFYQFLIWILAFYHLVLVNFLLFCHQFFYGEFCHQFSSGSRHLFMCFSTIFFEVLWYSITIFTLDNTQHITEEKCMRRKQCKTQASPAANKVTFPSIDGKTTIRGLHIIYVCMYSRCYNSHMHPPRPTLVGAYIIYSYIHI